MCNHDRRVQAADVLREIVHEGCVERGDSGVFVAGLAASPANGALRVATKRASSPAVAHRFGTSAR